ncbi:hypothetical protein EVAR_91953_1, partial [Eumeta japonica]
KLNINKEWARVCAGAGGAGGAQSSRRPGARAEARMRSPGNSLAAVD